MKGRRNGWTREPRVLLNRRRPLTDVVDLLKESEWPLRGTKWTKLHLDAGGKGKLDWTAPKASRAKTLRALTRGITWLSPPLKKETEITGPIRSEEHTSELQSLMRISYAVFCLKKKKKNTKQQNYSEMRKSN